MNDINTGGPAFPAVNHHGHKLTGMTLRDYFAAQAISIVMPEVISELRKNAYSTEKIAQLRAAAGGACYGIADAMLKARQE